MPAVNWLADQALDVYVATVRLNLGLFDMEAVVWVQSVLTKMVVEDATGKGQGYDYVPAAALDKEKRLNVLRHYWAIADILLMPIYSCEEGPRHWTLLVVRRREGAVVLKYYDTLAIEHNGCRKNAAIVLKMILGEKAEVPRRWNVHKQRDAECGWTVLHYAEENLREYRGEESPAYGLPEAGRLKQMRTWLTGWCKTLEATREKWKDEHLKKEAEEKAAMAAMARAAEAAMKAAGLLEALVAHRKVIAAIQMDEGAAAEKPPLPEGFGEKPKKVPLPPLPPPALFPLEDGVADEGSGGDKNAEADISEGGKEAEAEESGGGKKLAAKAKESGGDKQPEAEAMASGGYKKVEAEAMGSGGGEKPKAKAKAAAAAGKAAVKLTDMDEATINFAIDNWPPEKLRPEFLEKYNKVVATGLGVCSKCRCFNV